MKRLSTLLVVFLALHAVPALGEGSDSVSMTATATTDADAPKWKILHNQAKQALGKDDYVEAQRLWTDAIWDAEHSTPPQIEPGVVNCLVGLAMLNDKTGKYAESERLYELAMRDMEGLVGRGSARFSDFMADLADLYHRHGRPEQAEVTYRNLLSMREQLASLKQDAKPAERAEVQIRLAESLERHAKFLRTISRTEDAGLDESRAQAIRTSVQADLAKQP